MAFCTFGTPLQALKALKQSDNKKDLRLSVGITPIPLSELWRRRPGSQNQAQLTPPHPMCSGVSRREQWCSPQVTLANSGPLLQVLTRQITSSCFLSTRTPLAGTKMISLVIILLILIGPYSVSGFKHFPKCPQDRKNHDK